MVDALAVVVVMAAAEDADVMITLEATDVLAEDAATQVLEIEVIDAHLAEEVTDALVMVPLVTVAIEEEALEETLDVLKVLQLQIDLDALDVEIKNRNLALIVRGFFLPVLIFSQIYDH